MLASLDPTSHSDGAIAHREKLNMYTRGRKMWLVAATVLSATGGTRTARAQETANPLPAPSTITTIPSPGTTSLPTILVPAASTTPTKTPSSSPTAAPITAAPITAAPITPTPTSSPTISHQPTTTRYPTSLPTSQPTVSKAPTSSPTGVPTTDPTAAPTLVRSLEEFPYAKMSILGLDFLPNKESFDYWSETTSQWIVDWWGRDVKEIIGPDGNILPVIWPVDIVSVETFNVEQDVKKGDELSESMVMDLMNAARGVGFPGGRNSFMTDGDNTTSYNTTAGEGRHRHLTTRKFDVPRYNSSRTRILSKQHVQTAKARGASSISPSIHQRHTPRRLQSVDPTDPTLRLNTLLYSQNIFYHWTTNDTLQTEVVNPRSFATYPFLTRSDRDEYLNRLKANDPTGDAGTFQDLRASTPVDISDAPFTAAPTLAPTPPPAPSQSLSSGAIAGIIIGVILAVGVFGAWYVFRPLPGEGEGLSEPDSDKNVGWGGAAWANNGERYISGRDVGGGGSGGAPLYYEQSQSTSKLAKKLSKGSSNNRGKPSDARSRNLAGEESASLSQMSLRPFSTVKREGSGGDGEAEYRQDPRDISAISDNAMIEEGDVESDPDMEDSYRSESNVSDSDQQFGPHMLRVQEIEDM